MQIPSGRAPFYPLTTGLGKHGAMLLWWPGRGPLPAIAPGRCSRSQVVSPMGVNFEELDFRPTPMGALSLRRRRSLTSG